MLNYFKVGGKGGKRNEKKKGEGGGGGVNERRGGEGRHLFAFFERGKFNYNIHCFLSFRANHPPDDNIEGSPSSIYSIKVC